MFRNVELRAGGRLGDHLVHHSDWHVSPGYATEFTHAFANDIDYAVLHKVYG